MSTIGNEAVSKNSGADVGVRRRINFIEGTGVTLTIADDPLNHEIDVTIGGGTFCPLLEGHTAYVGFDVCKGASYTNYWTCDGVADDVQINAAIAYAVGLGNGWVELEIGTYDITASIVIAATSFCLSGQGRDTTLVSALGAGVDVISITALAAGRIVKLENFMITGNGTERHGIFASDCIRYDGVSNVYVTGVGGDGIHVEGCFEWSLVGNELSSCGNGITVDVSAFRNSGGLRILRNTFVGQDSIDILIDGTPTAVNISQNSLNSAGGDSIHVVSASRIKIIDNSIENATGEGIHMGSDAVNTSSAPHIYFNRVDDSGGNGINIDRTVNADVMFNSVSGSGGNEINITANSVEAFVEYRWAIVDGGTETLRYRNLDGIFQADVSQGFGFPVYTTGTLPAAATAGRIVYNSDDKWISIDDGALWHFRRPEVFVPVADPDSNVGDHPALVLPDTVDTTLRFQVPIPMDFQELVSAQVVVVQTATGGPPDMQWSTTTNWGKLCAAENYNAGSDAETDQTTAVAQNELVCIDVSASLDGIAAGDLVGFTFIRRASQGGDTIDADAHYLGFRLRYI